MNVECGINVNGYGEYYMAIVKILPKDLKSLKGDTDWTAVDELTDEEIIKAAKNDPDSALPTKEDLKKFVRSHRKGESKI